jgi:nicotinate-nucleotide adenylyltransferase
MTVGLFGGTFDPPHNGHVALLRGAERRFELERLLVLVVAEPGHRPVHAGAGARLELARTALPDYEIELDHHARTVDMLRYRGFEDAIFLIGADEFATFLSWKEPDGVLTLARLGVATRPGYSVDLLDPVLEGVAQPERVLFFEIEPVAVSSTDVRRKVAAGESIEDLVPSAVAKAIDRLGLYRAAAGEARLRPGAFKETEET